MAKRERDERAKGLETRGDHADNVDGDIVHGGARGLEEVVENRLGVVSVSGDEEAVTEV